MNDPTQNQARESYRTVRMLKERFCHKFQARARESGAPDCNERTIVKRNVVIAIDECGELSIEELADALHVTRPSASGAVHFSGDGTADSGIHIRTFDTTRTFLPDSMV